MLSRLRKILFVALLTICAPMVVQSGSERSIAGRASLLTAGYADDGNYKASFEMMEIVPPVSWLSEWLVV